MVNMSGDKELFLPLTAWPACTHLSTLAFPRFLRPAQGCVVAGPSATPPFMRSLPAAILVACLFCSPLPLPARSLLSSCSTAILGVFNVHLPPEGMFQHRGGHIAGAPQTFAEDSGPLKFSPASCHPGAADPCPPAEGLRQRHVHSRPWSTASSPLPPTWDPSTGPGPSPG